jgi:TRAP-type C4-dicarboxylate transport system permease small subunit
MGIDLLYVKFPKNIKKMNNIILSLISSLFFSITAWECYLYGNELKKTGEVSATLEISTYYIVYAISFACAVLALTLLVQFLNLFKEGHYE